MGQLPRFVPATLAKLIWAACEIRLLNCRSHHELLLCTVTPHLDALSQSELLAVARGLAVYRSLATPDSFIQRLAAALERHWRPEQLQEGDQQQQGAFWSLAVAQCGWLLSELTGRAASGGAVERLLSRVLQPAMTERLVSVAVGRVLYECAGSWQRARVAVGGNWLGAA